jgi:serine-type D-Ala-D-Ala carboxypeptidase/endopeptidase (penicillin-binding protein 4)
MRLIGSLICRAGLGSFVLSLPWGMPLSTVALPHDSQSSAQLQAQAVATSQVCPANLGERIAAIADRPIFSRSRWGILIQTQDTGTVLYAREANKYFIPASNAKLLTTAAALHRLGEQFRVQTAAYGTGTGGTLSRLHVVGQGDPSLTQTQLKQLAQQLADKGIRRIERLVADERYFFGDRLNPTWELVDIQTGDGPPINSLIVDENLVELKVQPQSLGQPLAIQFADPQATQGWQIENLTRTVAASQPETLDVFRDPLQPKVRVVGQLRVGSAPDNAFVAVIDPTTNFLSRFQQALNARQIAVGQIEMGVPGSVPEGSPLVAIASPPLSDLALETNRSSNNLYAEVLLRLLGAAQPTRRPLMPTADDGLINLRATLTQLKVDPNSYRLIDGSGLSRRNLISPQALVQTLTGILQSPAASAFQASLPVAGISGTLKNRLRGTAAQNNLRAKTGTLSDVSALSGYLKPTNFSPLVFSIIVNQADQPPRVMQLAIDEMILLLTALQAC